MGDGGERGEGAPQPRGDPNRGLAQALPAATAGRDPTALRQRSNAVGGNSASAGWKQPRTPGCANVRLTHGMQQSGEHQYPRCLPVLPRRGPGRRAYRFRPRARTSVPPKIQDASTKGRT